MHRPKLRLLANKLISDFRCVELLPHTSPLPQHHQYIPALWKHCSPPHVYTPGGGLLSCHLYNDNTCIHANIATTVCQTQGAVLLEKILGPDDAVDGLRWCVSYGTSWESLLSRLRLAFIAFSQTLQSKGSEHTVIHGIVAALHLATAWKYSVLSRHFSQQSERVTTFLMTVTCPRYPAVPLSMRGMSAAKHILLT